MVARRHERIMRLLLTAEHFPTIIIEDHNPARQHLIEQPLENGNLGSWRVKVNMEKADWGRRNDGFEAVRQKAFHDCDIRIWYKAFFDIFEMSTVFIEPVGEVEKIRIVGK